MTDKKCYLKPVLKSHGNVKDITKGAPTGAHSDTAGRSRPGS